MSNGLDSDGVPVRNSALRAREHHDIRLRIGDTLADPPVFGWTAAHDGNSFLMHLIVEI